MKWEKPLLFAVVAGLAVGFIAEFLVPFLGVAGTYAGAVADFLLIFAVFYLMEKQNLTEAAIVGAVGTIVMMLALPSLTPYLGFAGTYAAVVATIIVLFVSDWALLEFHVVKA
jgi:hypothetical protein